MIIGWCNTTLFICCLCCHWQQKSDIMNIESKGDELQIKNKKVEIKMNKVINYLENSNHEVIERKEGVTVYNLGEVYKVKVYEFTNDYTVIVQYKEHNKTVDRWNIDDETSEEKLNFILEMLKAQSETKPAFDFEVYSEEEIDELLANDINGLARLDKKLHMNLIYSILTQGLDRKKYWKILDNSFSTLDKFLEYSFEDVNNHESIYKFKLPNGIITMNENVSRATAEKHGVDGAEYQLSYQEN